MKHYWTIYTVPRMGRTAPEARTCQSARELFQTFPRLLNLLTLPNSGDKEILAGLLSWFKSNSFGDPPKTKAETGLALRCYVSSTIVQSCKKLVRELGSDPLLFQVLISRVLNDDGQTLIVLEPETQEHYVLEQNEMRLAPYQFVTVQVLATYCSEKKKSLKNWTHLQIRQHPETKKALKEFGVELQTDWALLNGLQSTQVNRLPKRSQQTLQAYRAVYRRDRRRTSNNRTRCADPSEAQLQEMLDLLAQDDVLYQSTNDLRDELKAIALEVRVFEKSSTLDAPELMQVQVQSINDNALEPQDSLLKIKQNEIRAFIQQELTTLLSQAIAESIEHQLALLRQSRRAKLEPHYLPGLKLYYCDKKSTRQISEILGIAQSKVSRLLAPKDLVQQTFYCTRMNLMDIFLKKAHELGLITAVNGKVEPNYLQTLLQELSCFLNEEIFDAASSEIQAGKNRKFDSLYAQFLKQHLKEKMEVYTS